MWSASGVYSAQLKKGLSPLLCPNGEGDPSAKTEAFFFLEIFNNQRVIIRIYKNGQI